METKIILLSAADDFIKSTHLKMSAKIDRTLLLLAQYGYKLRVSQGNNIARLFYFHYGRQVFVVTSGYMKKSQKNGPTTIN